MFRTPGRVRKVICLSVFKMISVVVAVYQVEKYLRQCVESILAQTYSDIDVVLVDDGSQDSCPELCDEFAARDRRVRTYHIDNAGIAAARNFGLERAREIQPEYVIFADGDDWLEPEMLRMLHDAAEEEGADISVCGWYTDYVDMSAPVHLKARIYDNADAMKALLCQAFRFTVWNKLWRLELLDGIEFPAGSNYEDVRTTYRFFSKAKKVVAVSYAGYHYRQRGSSIVRTQSYGRLLDRWRAAEQIFAFCEESAYCEDKRILYSRLSYCAVCASQIWASIGKCTVKERKLVKTELKQISAFVRKHFPVSGLKDWSFYRKCIMILVRRAFLINYGITSFLNWINTKRKAEHAVFE